MPIPKSEVYGRNITPDPETGIGKWTNQQIVRAIREGVRPDSSVIGPPMAFRMYRGIADADVNAMVAYLRTLPPVRNQVPPAQFGIPVPPSYGPPITTVVVAPPRTDLVKYGEYLAGPIGACMNCHTGSSSTPTADDLQNRLGSGGRTIHSSKGAAVASNLTPHETGLGKWSDADIEKAIRKGVRPDGTELKPPMPYPLYDNIGVADMRAIIAYLRSLKPLPLGG